MNIVYSLLIALIATIFLVIGNLAMVELKRSTVIILSAVSFVGFFLLSYFFEISKILMNFI